MYHIAIMKKSWGLIEKILSGEKIIESRWYKTKHILWDKIDKGDMVYFKNSGEPISVQAKVEKILQLSDLTTEKVLKLLKIYGRDDGIPDDKIPFYFHLFKDKKYCLLIFLKNVRKIDKPFQINKKGFGAMAAWISVEDIEKIKM